MQRLRKMNSAEKFEATTGAAPFDSPTNSYSLRELNQ
jgi:hypothetical protein